MSDLPSMWQRCGVIPGKPLLLHASARRTLKAHGITPTQLIRSFLDALDRGSLLIPAFTWEWCKSRPYNARTSPGQGMGVLCETALGWPGAFRTRHPIYSVVVIGPAADEFREGKAPSTGDTNDALGHGGPWDWLRMKGGRIGVLDLPDQNSMTAYHWVENVRGAHWRYFKQWTADYTDENGVTSRKTYGMPVRLEGTLTNVNPAGQILWDQGLYRGELPGSGAGLRTIDVAAFYDAVGSMVDAIRQGALDHRTLYLKHDAQMAGYAPHDMLAAG